MLALPRWDAPSSAGPEPPSDYAEGAVDCAGCQTRWMDWYLDSQQPEAVPLLRHEATAYLKRHAEDGSDLDSAELLLSEAVANAVRHASGPVWVSLSWLQRQPTLTVFDLGDGFDPRLLDDARHQEVGEQGLAAVADSRNRDGGAQGGKDADLEVLAESGRGLFLINELAPDFRAAARRGRGMMVSATLPVSKPGTTSHDPRLRRTGVLPDLSEVRPEGGFGKESFLRALVVQLAATLEFQHGPDAAESAVAQVGMDVGGQMEQEYRDAKRIVGQLTPDQMAHCYVRLKHAIDGGFYVIEANSDRIILGNRRCPFGAVVQKAPSLCRMTSSVFGGIAARNSQQGASVVLEERIAVGDPGCRVVVYLGSPPVGVMSNAHAYGARVDTSSTIDGP